MHFSSVDVKVFSSVCVCVCWCVFCLDVLATLATSCKQQKELWNYDLFILPIQQGFVKRSHAVAAALVGLVSAQFASDR